MTYFGAFFDEHTGRAWMLQNTRSTWASGGGLAAYHEKMYYHAQSNTLFGGLGNSIPMFAIMAMLHGVAAPTYADAVEGSQMVLKGLLIGDQKHYPKTYNQYPLRNYALGFDESGAAKITLLHLAAKEERTEPHVTDETGGLGVGFSFPLVFEEDLAERARVEGKGSHVAPVRWKVDRKTLPAGVIKLAEEALSHHYGSCENDGPHHFGRSIGGELQVWSTDATGNFEKHILFEFPELEWHGAPPLTRLNSNELAEVMPQGSIAARYQSLIQANLFHSARERALAGLPEYRPDDVALSR